MPDPTSSVVPFEFLKGKPEQERPTFSDFLAKRDQQSLHPSLQDDIPDDDVPDDGP